MGDTPETLLEVVRYFSDLDICHQYLRKIRWPRGPVCPHCESKKVGIISRQRLRCKECRKDVRDKAGTIFEDSPLGLDKWFVAVWSVANCKNGISSHELARALGVTQKTAWFMTHRIRKAMEVGSIDQEKFDGPTEADATYIGGKAANMHKHIREKKIVGRGAVGKAIVHGILQRGEPSQVRADVVRADDAAELVPVVRRNVKYGAHVYTDDAAAYGSLALTHWHQAIDHSREYVRGAVHTNGMENFFACLKRALGGTYIAVAPFHLFRYTAEQVYRFNHRLESDFARFENLVRQGIGKRLTYRVLTAKDDAGFMGLT